MSSPLPSYLRTHRKRWALSQKDLGALLGGVSGTAIAKYETLRRKPPVSVVLGCEIIFGERAQELFPALHGKVRDIILGRAGALLAAVEGRADEASLTKKRLLSSILERKDDRPTSV